MKRGLKQKKSTGRQTLVSKVSYVKRNWQLYVFFLMPALVLTIIFLLIFKNLIAILCVI